MIRFEDQLLALFLTGVHPHIDIVANLMGTLLRRDILAGDGGVLRRFLVFPALPKILEEQADIQGVGCLVCLRRPRRRSGGLLCESPMR